MHPDILPLLSLLDGLNVQVVGGTLLLDRPGFVRHLATAALRGIAGHELASLDMALLNQWFKPGSGGNTPAACLFQPRFSRAAMAGGFAFRIVTWDPPGLLLPALCTGLTRAAGRPFGETGARVAAVHLETPDTIRFTGLEAIPGRAAVLHCLTPVCVRADGQWLGEEAITFGDLVAAAVARLNRLSAAFGNRQELDPRPFLAAAACVRETGRDLEWVRPCRRSSTQGTNLALSGVVGSLGLDRLTPLLASLFCAVEVFHVGRHTTEGCGLALLQFDADVAQGRVATVEAEDPEREGHALSAGEFGEQ